MRSSDVQAPVGARGLRPILEYLIDAHGVQIPAQELDATLRRAEDRFPESPLATLRRLASEAGLTTAIVRRPLGDVVADADPAYPWLALREEPDGRIEAIAVLKAARGGALVAVPGLDSRPGRWSMESLRRWLKIDESAMPVDWILAEPAAPLAPMRSPEGGDTLSPFARLRALLSGERRTLWVAVIYSIVIGLLTLVLPVAVQSLVNTIAFGSARQPLVVLTLFVFVALAFSMVLNAARAGVVEIIQRSFFARVATDVTWRLLRVRAEAFDKYHGPELVNRFFDTVTVQKSAALLLIDGLSIFMQTVIGMVLLAVYHPYLLVFDVLLILAMGTIVFVLGRGAVHTSIKESKAKYELEAWLEQIAAHLLTFKSAGGSAYAVRRSQRLLEAYLTYRRKHFKILLHQIIGSFALQAAASSALLGIGGWLVIERQLTLGQLVASELVVAGMMSAFTKFGKQLEVYYDLCAAIDKLGVLVDLPLERSGGEAETRSTTPASLSIRDAHMKHSDDTRPALTIRAWDVTPGERVGITGPTGAGKSTLADLLFGLRVPTAGSLRLDGVDVRALPLERLRRDVAVVRDVELFDGSVFDNVRLGRHEVTYEDVSAALAGVWLLDEILALPKGLDTPLHPYGRPLSVRQARRLMLARAIVGRPRLLILDGALDHVEEEVELARLADTLFAPSAPWTLLCITERPSVLAHCSRVVRMHDGEIREAQPEEVQ